MSFVLVGTAHSESFVSNSLARTGFRLDATALPPSPAHTIFVPPRLVPPATTEKPSDLYSTVTNLWWNGPKTNILAIAEERLAANTNDIVGLVLKTEYDISFSPASVLSNSFRRVLSVGAEVDTPAFAAAYPRIAWNVSGAFVSLERYTDAIYREEHHKGFLTHKAMNMQWAWDALHEDGWLDVSPTNRPPSGP